MSYRRFAGVAMVLVTCGLLMGAGEKAGDPSRPKDAEPVGQARERPSVEELDAVLRDSHSATGLAEAADLLSHGLTGLTTLTLSIEHQGRNLIIVEPGTAIGYEVVGLLSDDANEGLALFAATLMFSGGDLTPADEPTGTPTPECDNPMINFSMPWGITNPTGFGGTMIDGDLVQVGGGQNTINNIPDNAPFPIGPVLTGVAQPSGCGPVVLITGTVTAPMEVGSYTLTAMDAFANVIKNGETGEPFWATEAVEIGEMTPLIIRTVSSRGPRTISRSIKSR